MSAPILKQGARGDTVRKLQRTLGVDQDGVLGPRTWSAWRTRFVTLGGWGFSGTKTRARRRWDLVMGATPTASEAKRAAKLRKKVGTGPQAALAFFKKYHGRRESPPGSNRGNWGLTGWQQSFGAWLVGQAWCGIICGKALQAAGVKGITSRVASVFLILDDALNSRNGFEKCVYRRRTGLGSTKNIRPGDLVGVGGESTHVEMVEKVTATGVWTRGGNTSPGDGSVADGGAVAYKFRPWSAVVYGARPAYPKD